MTGESGPVKTGSLPDLHTETNRNYELPLDDQAGSPAHDSETSVLLGSGSGYVVIEDPVTGQRQYPRLSPWGWPVDERPLRTPGSRVNWWQNWGLVTPIGTRRAGGWSSGLHSPDVGMNGRPPFGDVVEDYIDPAGSPGARGSFAVGAAALNPGNPENPTEC